MVSFCSNFFVTDRDKAGREGGDIAKEYSLVTIDFVSEDSNIAIYSVHQAVDRLDVVVSVDECPANLVVHQVVGFMRIVLAGVEEEALAVHGWVGLR